MGSFLTKERLAFTVVVKFDVGNILQNLMKKRRSFFRKNSSRLWIAYSRAGCEDVGQEQLRSVIRTATDYAALGITSIGLPRIRGTSDDGDFSIGISCESQSGGCAGNAATNDEYLSFAQCCRPR